MAAAGVQIEGLAEFRKALKQLEDPKVWTRELGKVNQRIAREVAGWARGNASGMGGPYAHFAKAIAGAGGVTGAKVRVGNPKANATFWGAKKHTGWYAAPRYAASPPQHPAWVGAAWEVGGGGGPYAINPAIASHIEGIVDSYADGVDDIARRAFPN